jgi:DNA-binding transcriptional MerR regulator
MAGDETLTLNELAARVGISARTIRDYQRRGLIPRPIMRGRVGIYTSDHRDRLEVIADLKRQGLSLGSVSAVIARHADADQAMRTLSESAERFRLVSADRLPLDPTVMRQLRALDENTVSDLEVLGLIVRRGSGYSASPRVMTLLRELLSLEVRSTALVRVLASIRALATHVDLSTAALDREESQRARSLILALVTTALSAERESGA